MKLLALIIAVLLLICLVAFDFILIPWVLMNILGWFGLGLSFFQCLVIVLFFNIVTYGFRKRD